MQINKLACVQCNCTGRETIWTAEIDEHIIRQKEVQCQQCGGKGYTTYPVFTVDEAIKIAKHFGFDIIGED